MRYLILFFLAALPSVAATHETPALPHVHPHGTDLLLWASLAVAALALVLWRANRRR